MNMYHIKDQEATLVSNIMGELMKLNLSLLYVNSVYHCDMVREYWEFYVPD